MRFVLVLVSFLISLTYCFSQDLPTRDGKVFYEHTIQSLEKKKEQILVDIKSWMAEKFDNPGSVIQSEDKEAGIIIGKAVLPVKVDGMIDDKTYDWSFTMKIQLKDSKARIQIYNIENGKLGKAESLLIAKHKKKNKQILKALNAKIEGLIAGFRKKMVFVDDF